MPSPLIPKPAKLINIVPMTVDNYLFEFSFDDENLKKTSPGQFVELWLPGVGESPISICSAKVNDTLDLLIRRVGRVTNSLYLLKEGSFVGLRGPYGTGFPVAELVGQNICLVAGGLGIAPIRSLWQYILNNRQDFKRVVLIYGMRHSDELLFRQEFKVLLRRHDFELYLAAEEIDGPGQPAITMQAGRVTDLIRLSNLDESFRVAMCGPPIMYQYAIKELSKKNIGQAKMWLSLERHMKCGIGKCGHCVIGGTFTCKQGPVFNLSKLKLTPEVIEC